MKAPLSRKAGDGRNKYSLRGNSFLTIKKNDMRIIRFIIASIGLCLLLAGCGKDIETRPPWEMPDSMLVKPEPPQIGDTIITEPPTVVPDTVSVPEWSEFWWADYTSLNANMECLNLAFRQSENGEDSEMYFGNIVGTWKLLIQFDPRPYPEASYPTDYSCRSVLYVFDADTTLTVISDTTAIPYGKFKYAFIGNSLCVGIDLIPELRIGEEGVFCLVADQMMRTDAVSYMYVDGIKYIESYGERRYFLKIKN
jgi:hypothetical protein